MGKLIERKGDMFTSDAKVFGHGVNCHGVMGAGVAAIVREKWPLLYDHYQNLCKTHQLLPGTFFRWDELSSGEVIFNIASQDLPGKDARSHWLYKGLIETIYNANRDDIYRIAIPEIGCGIGGLEKDIFYKVVNQVLKEAGGCNVDLEVWTLV